MLDWVKKALRKDTATGKTICVASSRALKEALEDGLRPIGIEAQLEGELLGVDYAAGGRLRRRAVQNKRRTKARCRLGKLKWLRRHGGPARAVARGGVNPEMSYGDQVIGMTNSLLRDLRRAHAAATTLKVAGSSTTAKLALGGGNYEDFDPAVVRSNPPMASLLMKLWDQPRSRADFIRSWRQADEEIKQAQPAVRWTSIRGPVGAAMAHLMRVEASWPRPFTIRALDEDVDLLTTPPLQIMEVLRAHARRYYDAL